jgi:hypothetical protein
MVVGVVLVGCVTLATWGGGEGLAPGVTRDAIRSVRVGMAEEEVREDPRYASQYDSRSGARREDSGVPLTETA